MGRPMSTPFDAKTCRLVLRQLFVPLASLGRVGVKVREHKRVQFSGVMHAMET